MRCKATQEKPEILTSLFLQPGLKKWSFITLDASRCLVTLRGQKLSLFFLLPFVRTENLTTAIIVILITQTLQLGFVKCDVR
jgi:hypothetical protein